MVLYFALLWIPLYLLGWVLIPLAAGCGAYKQDSSGLYHFTWPFMAIYDNKSDGITCQDKDATGNYVFWPTVTSLYGRIWRWSAMRNPLASITIIPLVHCAIQPSRVGFDGTYGDGINGHAYNYESLFQYDTKTVQWFVAWCGFFSCFYWQFKWNGGLWLFWFGSKIIPPDIKGVATYRTPRTYNTIQFNRQA